MAGKESHQTGDKEENEYENTTSKSDEVQENKESDFVSNKSHLIQIQASNEEVC